MSPMIRKVFVFNVLFLLAFSPWVAANKGLSKPKPECRLISSDEAIRMASQQVQGKLVSVKLVGKGMSATYRVRFLVDDKRVKNITIKACR